MSIPMYESRLNVFIIKNEIKIKTYSLFGVSFGLEIELAPSFYFGRLGWELTCNQI